MIRPLALIYVVSGLLAGGAAYGQVHVDSGALDSLSASPSSASPSSASPSSTSRSSDGPSAAHSSTPERGVPARRASQGRKPPPVHHPASATKPPEKTVKQASKPTKPEPPARPAPPVTIAPSAPPVAVIAPPPPMPAPHPVAPPLIPMVAGAVGEVTTLPGGLRITFGAGKADLSPATVEILHRVSQALIANPNADVNISGYAAGAPDDPSTPRRLSLSRVLAVRAVLIGDKIASTRIYPRALGSTPSDGPADRVDVQQAGGAGPPPVATPPLAPAKAPDATPSVMTPAPGVATAPAKTSPLPSPGLAAPRTP